MTLASNNLRSKNKQIYLKKYLCILLYILFITFGNCKNLNIVKKVAFIGKIFAIEKNFNDSIIAYPLWLNKNSSLNKKIVQYFGIPQLDNLGQHIIVNEEDVIEAIDVVEETNTVCENGIPTIWIEILQNKNLNKISTIEQIGIINNIFETINSAIKDPENKKEDFRVFPLSYLKRYRTITKTFSDDFNTTNFDHNQMVVTLNISCGELTDYASEVINVIAENLANFRIIAGGLNNERIPILTTTTALKKTSFRTTRQITDNRPVAFNRLSNFQCKQGILCRIDIGENTFMDPEDGTTSKLKLLVSSLNENQKNFLIPLPQTTILEGVAIDVGTYNFRIEARDRYNQAAFLPFQVNVEESPKPNHQFIFLLDSFYSKFKSKPENLRDFVYRLSSALRLKREHSAALDALNVYIFEVVENGLSQVIVKWSNTTFSRRNCQENLINNTRNLMLGGKNYDRVRTDFRRNMGALFHIKKISLKLLSNCLFNSKKILDGLNVRATTTEMSIDAEPTSNIANILMILLILIAVFLLLITLLTLFYCLQKKHKQQKKKQKKNDFVSKGLPVVFPEEVPYKDDDVAGVTTPMLVSREKPPMDPSQMTLHENPLYIPPPTAQATLKKLPSINPTSTFSTPPSGSKPLLFSLTNSSISAVGQRLPPPYVAAI